MSSSHGFFVIELLLAIMLVTWLMSMILRHNVGSIKQQIQASNSLKAMETAQQILESAIHSSLSLKQSTRGCNTLNLNIKVLPLPPFVLYDALPSLNLSCLQSLAIVHITACNRESNIPLWCTAGVTLKDTV